MKLKRFVSFVLLNWLLGQATAQAESVGQCIDSVLQLQASAEGRAGALKQANSCIGRFPQAAAAYITRAHVYLLQGQNNQAIQDYSKALALDAGNAQTLIERGQAYWISGNPTSALQDYSQALVLAPDSSHAYLERGYLLEASSENIKALADYQQAIRYGSDK